LAEAVAVDVADDATTLRLTLHWKAYNGDALSQEAVALQTLATVVPLTRVQRERASDWPLLRD